MTCIVGYIDKVAYIGGDSAASGGDSVNIRKDPKVFRNGDFIFGCVGSYRMIQLLMYSFKPPVIEKEIHEYMCTDFIDAVRECFRQGGYIAVENLQESGGSFMVGYKDRLFSIFNNFQVAENVDNFATLGVSMDTSAGAMFCLDKLDLSPEEKITKALEASEYINEGVRRPFIIINANL